MTLSNGRTSAYQWDYGLSVVTEDADGTIARIANEHGSKAFVVEAENGLYRIPDILLTTGRAVVLYHVSGEEGTSLYTTSEDFLPVSEAPKPDDYIFTDEEIRTWQELDDRLTDAEETIVQHTGEIATNASNIAQNASAIAQNTADIAQNTGNIAQNTGNIAQNTGNIAQNTADIAQNTADISSLETDVNALESSVNALETDVDALANDVNALETDVDALETDVNALETGKISDPATKSADQVLTWDGTEWVAQTPADPTDIFYVALSNNIPTCTGADIHNALVAGKQVIVKTSMREYSFPSLLSDSMAYDPPNVVLEYYTTEVDSPSATITKVTLVWSNNSWRRATEVVTFTEGGGGTDDYTDLSNKPQINSVTLSGNKSSSDLGLADAVHTHSQYLTQETDPTVPSWAKQATKPAYTAAEVGALPDDTEIPTKVSDLTNDSGFITTETDPTVPSWAKASTKPTYTASEVGAIPVSPTGLGAFLRWDQSAGQWVKSDISASDVGAMPNPHSDFSPSDGDVIVYNGTQGRWDVVAPEDSGLIPTPASPSAGDVLTYSNGEWVPQTPSSGTTDYTDLTNKPSINNVTLSGNKTTSDLGISLTSLPDVFIATYNTTTIAELDAARTAGKKIFLGTSDGVLRPLTEYSWSPKIYSFISGEGDGKTISIISCALTGNTTVWSSYRHSYLWANTLIGPPNDGEVLTYNSSSDTWMAMPLPESAAPYVITLDDSTGLPTDNINDVLDAYNNGKILVVTNGSDYWYGRYVADGASEFYMMASYASGNSTSTLTLTYDYTNDEWSSSIDDWSFVPTSRTVNGKALSSNISLTSSDVGAIANPSSKSTGQFLSWNGSAWVATSLPVWNGGVT